MSRREDDGQIRSYSRREALAAMVKYSAALGGATATIVSAEAVVAQASAYNKWCEKRPDHPLCVNDGPPGQGGGNGNNGRVRF